MSHTDHTLQDGLEQHLEALKVGEDLNDYMRYLLGWLLQEVLDLEFSQFLGAAPYERSQDRKRYRNGYYQRELFTRVGRLTLRVPRDRQGSFSTDIFERYQRSEKTLVLTLQESYLQGVSTRKVKKITEKLCGVQFSKDQVSSIAQELDEELAAWRSHPLKKAYPYLVVDAHYEYVREDGLVESDNVLLVKGLEQTAIGRS
jgi:putative transposase